MNKLIPILVVAGCSILGAIGQICFKMGSETFTPSRPLTFLSLKMIAGLVCYGLASIIFILMLRQANLTILYPIIALSYVWVAIMATWFLHEPFSTYKWAGIALILAGVFVIVK